jgi:HEAT repeat protein
MANEGLSIMLENAFESLMKLDWGSDLAVLAPIEDAVAQSHGKPDDRKQLEDRLLAALNGKLSRDAQDYVCRKLATVGSAAAVPVLASLLVNKDNSHMARFALEQIPAPEAADALRDALSKVSGNLKIGVISSLGGRRDASSITALGGLLHDSDSATARAAALALGAIGNAEAAAALQGAAKAAGRNATAIMDALLQCAEMLLANRKSSDAGSIYKALDDPQQPRLIRLAATRGLLACAVRQA